MAFDMYMGRYFRNTLRFGLWADKIDDHDYILFRFIEEGIEDGYEKFPALVELGEKFYDGPMLTPDQCEAIADELLELRTLVSDENLNASIGRLSAFFLKAHSRRLTVWCHCD